MFKNNKGFSLIELMVVVAIIAILSSIAIPSYQSFQAKARQKEGFAMLSSYYQAAHASRAEYGHFPGNLANTGFSVTGQLGYRLTSAHNATAMPYGLPAYAMCLATNSAAASCPTNYMNEWTDAGAGVVLTTLGSIAPSGAAAMAAAVTNTSFTTVVSGVVSTKAPLSDQYTMNNLKVITAVTDGLK